MSIRRTRIARRAFFCAAASVITSPLFGIPRAWDGSSSQDWNTAANWTPAAIPNNTDAVTIALDSANITLSANAQADSLTINTGAQLNTGSFSLVVDDRITLTENTASAVQLAVANGVGVIDLDTDFFDIRTGALLSMNGGTARIRRTLDIDAASFINGNGVIEFSSTSAAAALDHRGNINVAGGNLHLKVSGAGSLDLDGSGAETGTLTVLNGAHRLIVDGPLSDGYGGTLTVGDENTAEFTRSWSSASNSTINLSGGNTYALAAVLAGPSTAVASIGGRLFVTNQARLTGPVSFHPTSNISGSGTIHFEGGASFDGGTCKGGVWIQSSRFVVEEDTSFAPTTWSPVPGALTIVNSGAELTFDGIALGIGNVFLGDMTLNGSRYTCNAPATWELAGALNMSSFGTFTARLGGTKVLVSGKVRATNSVDFGVSAVFTNTADVRLTSSTGTTMLLSFPTEFWGGSYTGPGTIGVFDDATIHADTTMSTGLVFGNGGNLHVNAGVTLKVGGLTRFGQFTPQTYGGDGTFDPDGGITTIGPSTTLSFHKLDWDGSGGFAVTTVGPGSTLILDVDHIDAVGDAFSSVAVLNGGNLIVSNSADQWELLGFVSMNQIGTNIAALGGETLRLSGQLASSFGTSMVNAPIRYSGGSAIASAGCVLQLNGPLSSLGVQSLSKAGAGTVIINGPQTHNANALIHIDNGLLIMNTDPGSSFFRPLKIDVGTAANPAEVLFNADAHVRSLHVISGQARLAPDASRRLVAFSIAVDPGAAIDLADGILVVDYSGTNTALAQVKALLASGYNNGAWNGSGIRSSLAATNSATALGYGEASTILGISGTQTASFAGEIVDATSLLVRYTLYGDTNLDKQITFVDLLAVSANFGINHGTATWPMGDFNYDGNVGFTDLLAVAANFGGVLPAFLPGASPEFNAALANVPEPTLNVMIAGFLLSRLRRRRAHSPPLVALSSASYA